VPAPKPFPATVPPWWQTLLAVGLGCALAASAASTWLSQRAWATVFLSPPSWEAVGPWLSASGKPVQSDVLDAAYLPCLLVALLVTAVAWPLGALVLASRRQQFFSTALRRWGRNGWLWWCLLGLWEWVWVALAAVDWEFGANLWVGAIPFWTAFCLSGWLFTGLSGCVRTSAASAAQKTADSQAIFLRAPRVIWLFVTVYVAVFVTMNWRLWFNLYLPHGDSAMYEEHLWNLFHGKGFRSYLDQGLFLGEHIQVVHLSLWPFYVLWPSHLMLELCESVALACGAWPVAWMTLRHTGSRRAAACAAAAYLLYFPLQFLDIEIDLKTFRPEAFGIPLLLCTLDQLDRGRWRGFLLGVVCCLMVKEDYSLVLGPLGVWIAATAWWRSSPWEGEAPAEPRTIAEPQCLRGSAGASPSLSQKWCWFWLGLGLAVFSVAYLFLATRVVMPYFRPGEEIHYTRYFSRLGDSPEAIVRTILTRPGFVAGEVLTTSTWLYALALLVPVGFVALLSPGRLAVGLPLFGVLCLNELARDPRHHFHAPLVAIVFWAVAAGLANVPGIVRWLRERYRLSPWDASAVMIAAGHWLWISALCSGLFFSLSPLGLAFWDPGSNWNWHKLYGPSRRGVEFAKIAPLIPKTARVASTDFVHPRFTHHARSYDYSGYARKVSGYEHRVPDDTEFIVIDTTHPYSNYHRPEDVPEYHQTDQWQLLPDETNGFFIVLKRR
jgi:uncharacterized membrane protein